MALNTTIITNGTGNFFVNYGTAINVNSGGLFGFMIVLALWIIPFMAALRFGVRSAFSLSAFIGSVGALFLRLIGWINDPVLFGSIVISVGIAIVLWFSNE